MTGHGVHLLAMREVNAARAATIVNRSERTIRRHLKMSVGALPARKTHNGWRIRLDDLLNYYGPDSPGKPGEPDSPDNDLVQQAQPAKSYTSLVQHDEPPAVTQGDFKTHADAARWLVLHGLHSEGTPKSWRAWMSTPLTHEDVLGKAIKLCDTTNHRIRWRLVVCGDSECVCGRMLGGANSAYHSDAAR